MQDSIDETTIRNVFDQNDDDNSSSNQNQQREIDMGKGIKNQKNSQSMFSINAGPSTYKSERGGNRRHNLFQSEQVQKNDVWKRKWMQIFYQIAKFRTVVREKIIFFRPHMLKKVQVYLINDRGSSMQYQSSFDNHGYHSLDRQFSFQNFSKYMTFRSYRKLIKCIVKYLGWFFHLISKVYEIYKYIILTTFSQIPLFHYLSYPYILWETIIFVCSGILFIYIPFEYSFQIERNSFFSIYFIKICPIVFGIDIFIRANTKSTETGTLVENHMKILKNYFRTDMIPDILSVISLNYQFLELQATYLFFFYRIFKSFRILDILKEQFLLRMKISGIISLIYLAAQVIYFAHLVCCVWYAIGRYELNENTVITMTTIGYGDITPQSDLERLIVILVALISCGVFGYSINSIGGILNDFKQKRNVYLQGIAMINKYFKQYDVDLELQACARKYLDYIYTDTKEELLCSIDQLSNLTEYLQDEIKANVNTKRLRKIKIFNELFSEDTLNRIALKMREKILSHDQDIMQINSFSEPVLCIVHSGIVSQYTMNERNKKIQEIQTFFEGQYFGLESFLQDSYYEEFNYKSNGICCVLQLHLNDFLKEIQKNPEEYEKYCYMRDEIKFNQNLKLSGASCFSCNQKNHSLTRCPFIFYEGKKDNILRKYLKHVKDQILKFKRVYPKKKFNSVANNQLILLKAVLFTEDHQKNISDDSSSQEHQDSKDEDNSEDDESQQNSLSIPINAKIPKKLSRKLSILATEFQKYLQPKPRKSSVLINPAGQSQNFQRSIQEVDDSQELDSDVFQQKPLSPHKKSIFNYEEFNENEGSNHKIDSSKEKNQMTTSCKHVNNKDRHSQVHQTEFTKQALLSITLNELSKRSLNLTLATIPIYSLNKMIQNLFMKSSLRLLQRVYSNNKLTFQFGINRSRTKSIAFDQPLVQLYQMLETVIQDKFRNTQSDFDKMKLSKPLNVYTSAHSEKQLFYSTTHNTSWDQSLFMYDFETLKSYTYYYPKYNCQQILEQIQVQNKSFKKIQVQKRLNQKQHTVKGSRGKKLNSSQLIKSEKSQQ